MDPIYPIVATTSAIVFLVEEYQVLHITTGFLYSSMHVDGEMDCLKYCYNRFNYK